MANLQREVEVRFDVPADATIPDLTVISDVIGTSEPAVQELTAHYFDTADQDLARAGIRLRRRTGGDDSGWHLKLPIDATRRHKIQVPLGRAVHTVPKVLREAVEATVRGATLHEIREERVRRQMVQLRGAEDRVLLEFRDNLIADTPRENGTAGKTNVTRQWELELVDGDPAHLQAAAKVLRKAGGTHIPLPTDTRAIMSEPTAATAGETEAGDDPASAGAVVLEQIRTEVARVVGLDPLVRVDAPDAVHQLRVSLRRLRSVLATFRPLFDRAHSDPLRDELRWLSQVLSPARDAEVLHAHLVGQLAAEPPELVVGPIRRRIDADLAARYREGHRAAQEAMLSDRHLALLDSLTAFVAEPPLTPLAAEPATDVLPARVASDVKRLRKLAATALAEPEGARNEALHEARKAAKRTRHGAEILTRVQERRGKRLKRTTRKIQSLLGDQHDAVVSTETLQELATQAHSAGENTFTYGRLHAANERTAAELAASFEQVWTGSLDRKLKRWAS